MENQYNEIKEYLRKQHNANRSEVHGRYSGNRNVYHYDDIDIEDNYYDGKNKVQGSNIFFFGKIILFIVAVLLFSCYIYGGQNLKKGSDMAMKEIKNHIVRLEQDNDNVKETFKLVKKTWKKVKDFTVECFEEYNIDNNPEED